MTIMVQVISTHFHTDETFRDFEGQHLQTNYRKRVNWYELGQLTRKWCDMEKKQLYTAPR